MSKAQKIVVGALVALVAQSAHSMVFDNRYIPLLQKPYISVDDRPSHCAGNFFVTTASKAIDNREKEIGIPELNGQFDLGQYGAAFDVVGLPNPLRADIQGQSIPFNVNGVIQAQGVEFSYYQSIKDVAGIGFNWLLMRSVSRQEFLPKKIAGIDNDELDRTRREMFKTVGLCESYATQAGMGDLDLYMRFGYAWDYTLKLKRIDTRVRVGALIPAGEKMRLNSPASIPFGGNGYWGMYAASETEVELREDMKVGLILRGGKRFARTSVQRLPVAAKLLGSTKAAVEPQIFGVITGLARVNPGATLIFSPYVMMENLRAGLGIRINYALTKHWADSWCDARCDKVIPIDLSQVNCLSAWKTDYISFTAFYDFGKVKVCRRLDPILIFTWDIPSLLFGSDQAVNMHKISLGLEFNF
ncbi:MAG: hypothetical protein NTX86_00925 [Candidatus Dependentiae bacterium]|nr:hypothetical protein [Candidatus Dependentiae bacterium]